MTDFLYDLRRGLRQLATRPGFTVAAILTLALGIGANTAVFSFLSGYLLKPLPYPHSDRLVEVLDLEPTVTPEPVRYISLPIYRIIKKRTDVFTATAFYARGNSNVTVGGYTQHVSSVYSSASLFSVLGVRPMLGKAFTADNMHAGNDDVAIISYTLWRNSFGADPNVIGKTVKLDDGVHRIIGVMPKSFAFPDRATALWVPYQVTPQAFAPGQADALMVFFIDRLKPGMSPATAKARVRHAVESYIGEEVPAKLRKMMRSFGFATDILPWRKVLLGDRPATLWLLQGAVLLILLMTCVNVANLLLSRILGRSHEMAMRSALGATRPLLARQLLAEALCLTVPGGIVGLVLCWLVLHFITATSFGAGEAIFSITLDWRVGLFAFCAVLLTAALVSLLPIRHLAKIDLQQILQDGSRTSGGGRRAKRTRNILVITELTLASALLAMSGLLLHSFMNLQSVDPGFRKTNVLMASLLVGEEDHAGTKALSNFYANLRQRVKTLPGVRQAAMARILPLSDDLSNRTFFIVGRALPPSGKPPLARLNRVSRGYFNAMGIPILRGRPFNANDAGKPTAIIDAALAQKYFRNTDPLGRQITFGFNGGKKYTIVGVVPPIKYVKLSDSAIMPTMYLDGVPTRVATLVVQTALPPGPLVTPLKKTVAAVDPAVSVYDVRTMHEQLSASLRSKRMTMTLLLAFGGIALVLAIVGVYAVMSYAVGQRRAECGVRLALGALPEDLAWMVLKEGLKLLVIGLVVGLGLAVVFGYLLSAQLYGVAPFDPVTLIGSAVVLCIVTLAACWLPARRAAKLDPAVAVMEQ
ncbi:MAG TPA: ABC transporter permease [Gammaproteobacteria bacterium]|nr:ABC transporter permease [Gammaproteobacteria bacterium]